MVKKKIELMRCWHCSTPMIWGADFSFEDYCMDGEGIVSNFTCPNCPAEAQVTLKESEDG